MDRRVIDRNRGSGSGFNNRLASKEARKMAGAQDQERTLPSGLVLARHEGEGVTLDIPPDFVGTVQVFVGTIKGTTARLLFSAPKEVGIRRNELLPTG
jgi:sRNA-binding carbon storage regulator CsrA